MTTDEKRDIVEVAEELGIELTYHEGAERPYYQAFCPLHPNTHTPAFAIFPNVQRFYCYGCQPDGGDVITLVMRKENLSYKQARKIATIELTTEEAFIRHLKKESTLQVDASFLYRRAYQINDHPRRLNFQSAQRLLQKFDVLMDEERWVEADRLLRNAGV